MPEKKYPGQPLRVKASDWNLFTEVSEAFQSGRLRSGGLVSVPGLNQPLEALNNTEDNVTRGEVMGIDGPVINQTTNQSEFLDRLTLTCTKPDIESHVGSWCLALESIPAGKFGKVAVSGGMYPVPLTVGYASHPFADITDDSYTLTSNWYGAAELLWAQGTGSTYGIIRLSNFQAPTYKGIVEEDIGAGASGDVDIVYAGADTNETITAHRWMENLNTAYEDAECLVRYYRDEQKWYIEEQECLTG